MSKTKQFQRDLLMNAFFYLEMFSAAVGNLLVRFEFEEKEENASHISIN